MSRGSMKRFLVPILLCVLIATGCTSTGSDEAAQSPTAPSTTATSAAPTPTDSSAPDTASVSPPTGSSVTSVPPSAPTVPSATATQPQSPTAPASTSVAPDSSAVSPRGNLIKQLGEVAGVRNAAGEELVEFTVNDIIVDIPCTQGIAEPPENGHFVALDVSVKTSSNLRDAGLSDFTMDAWDFQVIGPDGVTSNAGAASVAASWCLADAVELPDTIGPGETAKGLVLLDVTTPSGILVFKHPESKGSWEYTY